MGMNSPYLEIVFRFESELGQRKASGEVLGLREPGDFIKSDVYGMMVFLLFPLDLC